MLGRVTFFGERSSQLRGCVVAVAGGLVTVGDVVCPSACCCECVNVGECEIVDDGDSGPMFVTNSAPNFGAGIGDPGAFGTSSLSANPGTRGVGLFGSSGASLASRECECEVSPAAWVTQPVETQTCPRALGVVPMSGVSWGRASQATRQEGEGSSSRLSLLAQVSHDGRRACDRRPRPSRPLRTGRANPGDA